MREKQQKQNLDSKIIESSDSRRGFLKGLASLGALGAIASLGIQNALANTINTIKEQFMNLTNTAKSNFERLFGKGATQNAALKGNAEFFERYINFAFDENLSYTKALKEEERLMLVLGALIATQGLSEFKIMLQAALKNGVSAEGVQEILYQSTPYVGIGKALEFINGANEVFATLNIALPTKNRATTTQQNRANKGLEIQRKLFGEAIDKANASVSADEKHIRAFLSAHCFGDFYTREGLGLKFRELLTFVFVASLGGADAQVKAHIAGNLHSGNDRAILLSTITALIPYIGYPRALNALSALNELAPAKA